MKHTTTKLIATCAAILTMPMLANAQDADPFAGGGAGKPAKTKPSDDPFAAPAKAKTSASEDPFGGGATADEIRAAKEASKPRTIQVTYEAFSLPMKDAAAFLRTDIKDSELYQKMVEGVKTKKVKQEKMLIGRTKSGYKSTVEHQTEHIYNTEVDPPELPNIVGAGYNVEEVRKIVEKANQETDRQGAALVFPATPANPGAYDTRNVGDNMEIEATIAANLKTLDLRISVGHTSLIEYVYWGQGLSEAKMPIFSYPRVQTGVSVIDGIPAFTGSVSPPAELQPESGEKRTWLAFVTVDIVKH